VKTFASYLKDVVMSCSTVLAEQIVGMKAFITAGCRSLRFAERVIMAGDKQCLELFEETREKVLAAAAMIPRLLHPAVDSFSIIERFKSFHIEDSAKSTVTTTCETFESREHFLLEKSVRDVSRQLFVVGLSVILRHLYSHGIGASLKALFSRALIRHNKTGFKAPSMNLNVGKEKLNENVRGLWLELNVRPDTHILLHCWKKNICRKKNQHHA